MPGQGEPVPGPLPLGVAVIDSSVGLYGQVFPRVADKHRLQMLEHFSECIRSAKSSRQQAVQINIFTAVLCSLKVGAAQTHAHTHTNTHTHTHTLYCTSNHTPTFRGTHTKT